MNKHASLQAFKLTSKNFMQSFKELKVWQKAHELALLIYVVTAKFPADEKFGLVSQMRRAVVSVASNIVEGFHRNYAKVAINFYNIADASLEELRYQLLLSKDLKYLSIEDYIQCVNLSEEVSKMLRSWIRTQK